ncbi:ABC transporter substrate-binding protein [Gandjariella thermophila]|uniref:Sulfonate ABC transporter substrate-binding protein n=1 Tax=Gandjariella thermophila TaxID=1931992 RepID=A0A4D4J871_9PSEU|nr:ABC transporter substrate-binding protein [Gandjariella thermophila]GDY31422.1 sulfonate ABC transporter substrate-binding protein [Gandjariella thermophila]
MSPARRRTRALTITIAALAVLSALAGCTRAHRDEAVAGDQGPATELRLGFFPNVTHAAALIANGKGFFTRELGATKLTAQQFNAGPEEVTALLSGSLDAAFIGSGPAINAFAKSNGQDVRLIAGATSGGAQLVVKPGITSPEALKGKTITAPQTGNTQDIALKKWLAGKGLAIGNGPDQVHVTAMDNPQTFDAFRSGQVDGGWLPEPWASRLAVDAGAQVLQEEKALWPGGKFPTTVLIVRTQFLQEHPATVEALLRATQDAVDFAGGNHAEAETVVNDQLKKFTGKGLSQPVLDRAFADIELTADPLAAQFPQLAKDSVTAGVTKTAPDLTGFVDVTLLNRVLRAAGKPQVDAAGLDKK